MLYAAAISEHHALLRPMLSAHLCKPNSQPHPDMKLSSKLKRRANMYMVCCRGWQHHPPHQPNLVAKVNRSGQCEHPHHHHHHQQQVSDEPLKERSTNTLLPTQVVRQLQEQRTTPNGHTGVEGSVSAVDTCVGDGVKLALAFARGLYPLAIIPASAQWVRHRLQQQRAVAGKGSAAAAAATTAAVAQGAAHPAHRDASAQHCCTTVDTLPQLTAISCW